MPKGYRDLKQEYKNIKKLIKKNTYTKEEQRNIGIFKSNVNQYGKEAKVPKYALSDFNGAIDNIQNDKEEFTTTVEIIFAHLDGWYRR